MGGGCGMIIVSDSETIFRVGTSDEYYTVSPDRTTITFNIHDLARLMAAGRGAGTTPQEHYTLIRLAQSKKPVLEWLSD